MSRNHSPARPGAIVARWTWAFVGLGVALRLARYLMDFPLWGDESFVAVNFLGRGYRALLHPLEYGQICPLLFLWAERWVVDHFGFNELSLRAFAMVSGVASVFLFRHVSGRVVRGLPWILAVAIFAVSFHPIRHAAEVKPYASDLLVALALLAPALEWLRSPGRAGWLWGLAAITPVALSLSHPSVFIAGGVALGLLGPIRRAGRRDAWLAYLAFLALMAGSFLGLYALFTELQGRSALAGLRSYWADSFPPLDRPARLLGWLAEVHTGTMFAYPGGGRRGASILTTLAVVLGSARLWGLRRRGPLVMLLAPFALALVAATLRRYPYGGAARQMQFVAPSICILAGLGLARALRMIPKPGPRQASIAMALGLLALIGLASPLLDLAHPYRFRYDAQARDFARRFWPSQAREAELACVRWDFGIVNRNSMNLRTGLYLCNQAIYSPPRRDGNGPRWQAISDARPLRCVLNHDTPPDYPEVVAWLARMRWRYDLRRTETIAVNADGVKEGPRREQIVIFEFVPKAPPRLSASPRPIPGPAGRR